MAEPPEAVPVPDPAPQTPPQAAVVPAAPVEAAPVAQMTLRGVFHKEGTPPRFVITLVLPSGRVREIDGVLGDNIHAGWKAAEYSANMQKLTLARNGTLLVVKPGETLELPEEPAN
ncbi:MAG TPA: hypothetical protein PLI98_14440 [Candidatus Hydrogenedentes bacterium]|nr:hypothetical protein [Candidatus Hydrogenedentota bacterium]